MKFNSPSIRLAVLADATAILNIYKLYITNSTFTFETEIPSLTDFKKKIEILIKKHPFLVYEIDKQIVGYAYCSPHRDRIAYQWTVESSVYVHQNYHKKGIGKALYLELIKLTKAKGFTKILAGITEPNLPSENFHKAFNFHKIVTYKNIGYKLNTWLDVSWWELNLVSFEEEPNQLI